MCDKLKKAIDIFWLLFWLLCFLVPVRAIEITESELIELETLTSKQRGALEQSKADLKASSEAQLKSKEALRKAQTINKLLSTEIQALKTESAKLRQSISKYATSYAQLEIEKTRSETELKMRISIRNKIIAVLSVIVSTFIVFKTVKFLVFKKL